MSKPRHFTFEKDQRNGGILFGGDKIKVGEKIHVREVMDINWEKVFKGVHLKYSYSIPSLELLEDIKAQVEKQLAGEE